jgi:hypothetical protein
MGSGYRRSLGRWLHLDADECSVKDRRNNDDDYVNPSASANDASRTEQHGTCFAEHWRYADTAIGLISSSDMEIACLRASSFWYGWQKTESPAEKTL